MLIKWNLLCATTINAYNFSKRTTEMFNEGEKVCESLIIMIYGLIRNVQQCE